MSFVPSKNFQMTRVLGKKAVVGYPPNSYNILSALALFGVLNTLIFGILTRVIIGGLALIAP